MFFRTPALPPKDYLSRYCEQLQWSCAFGPSLIFNFTIGSQRKTATCAFNGHAHSIQNCKISSCWHICVTERLHLRLNKASLVLWCVLQGEGFPTLFLCLMNYERCENKSCPHPMTESWLFGLRSSILGPRTYLYWHFKAVSAASVHFKWAFVQKQNVAQSSQNTFFFA